MAAFTALEAAAGSAVAASGQTGVYSVVVNVAGYNVTVTGAVVNGVVRVGTAFIP